MAPASLPPPLGQHRTVTLRGGEPSSDGIVAVVADADERQATPAG
jgi:hypothetical protein